MNDEDKRILEMAKAVKAVADDWENKKITIIEALSMARTIHSDVLMQYARNDLARGLSEKECMDLILENQISSFSKDCLLYTSPSPRD